MTDEANRQEQTRNEDYNRDQAAPHVRLQSVHFSTPPLHRRRWLVFTNPLPVTAG